ncbi:CotH kinase family protein [Chondromyces apiculatus]|uniref:Inner spore coat protein H n=1 Tax=Chondromyces apiculatus DSM 436 TaxID=1192034 RepID=A0A017T946_9BACT|nr:CotH kinase family protein [Chondromyces apiculatus]EYF05106.1 Inner spore coat protein H [Chondromyces apiculatus DSM 436]
MRPLLRSTARLTLLLGALLPSACADDTESATGGPTTHTASDPPGLCAPSGGGPHWLREGETLTFTIGCTTSLSLDGTALEITGLPPGATHDPATGEVRFTPALDQAAVYDVTVHVPATDETTHVKIGVADAWDDPANIPVLDPARYGEEYGLPVLFLDRRPLTEEYDANTITYRGHAYLAEAKLRGASSLSYPKNSYTLKFAKDDRFQEPDEAFGFTDRRKLVLISTFDDNSYVRQRLAYDLWNALDPAHLQIKTYSAVVYIEGAYWGLYTVADHPDKDFMEAHGYSEDGNLYKAIDHDANFDRISIQYGGEKSTLHDGYEKKEGLPLEGEPGAFADLEALVDFVATSDSATFTSGIASRIDQRDYEDWWIFVTFILGSDSAGKNSYHYRDPTTDGVFRYMPWDFNDSFGQTWQTARASASTFRDYTDMNRLFERFLEEPTLGPALRARYADVLRTIYTEEAIQALVTGYIDRIDASARRDEHRWGEAYRTYGDWSFRTDFTTYDEELAYLRAWLTERWQFQAATY